LLTKKVITGLVTASPFASVVPVQSAVKQTSSFAKYVVLGFWKYVDNEYDCYRTFRVDFPCFQSIQQDKMFLHSAYDNQLVFFSHTRLNDQNQETVCNILDLKAAMTDNPDSRLERLTSFLYKAPVSK
jgi:hypothetical protein